MTSSLVGNPQWRLFLEGDRVFLSGGADEVYMVDEVPTAAAAHRLMSAAQHNDFDSLLQDKELAAALRQLRNIGAIATTTPMTAPVVVALLWAGDAIPALSNALTAQLSQSTNPATLAPLDAANFIVVVRSNASWLNTIAVYEQHNLKVPHLFVDVAYRHTVGMGPYVVPGDTACIACLGHRIAHQWGDAPIPIQPKATLQIDLLAGLIRNAIDDFTEQGMCTNYLERAVSLNLQTLHSQLDRVFRLPWCPVCTNRQAPAPLTLPWASENQAK